VTAATVTAATATAASAAAATAVDPDEHATGDGGPSKDTHKLKNKYLGVSSSTTGVEVWCRRCQTFYQIMPAAVKVRFYNYGQRDRMYEIILFYSFMRAFN